jgi:hypothetical protein
MPCAATRVVGGEADSASGNKGEMKAEVGVIEAQRR